MKRRQISRSGGQLFDELWPRFPVLDEALLAVHYRQETPALVPFESSQSGIDKRFGAAVETVSDKYHDRSRLPALEAVKRGCLYARIAFVEPELETSGLQ